MWDQMTKERKQKVDVQLLTLFILCLFNLKTEMANDRSLNPKKIQQQFKNLRECREQQLKLQKSQKKEQKSTIQTEQQEKSVSLEKNKKMAKKHRRKILE